MQQTLDKTVEHIGRRAKKAAYALQSVSEKKIEAALYTTARLLDTEASSLQKENRRDLRAARDRGLPPAMIDRLTLSDSTVAAMARGLREVAAMDSPIGTEYEHRVRPNGLSICKVKVPIGVVGIIYEARPNVTVDAAAICLKSQNAVVLRGGSEAFRSNRALISLFKKAIAKAKLPSDAVQMIPTVDRRAVELLLQKDDLIDLIIPRGGEELIRTVVEKSRIPVIKHYKGVCHVYIAASADIDKAVGIAVNAKVQRPGVCNAMETLLLDAKLPRAKRRVVIDALLENGVALIGDSATRKLSSRIKEATVEDWKAEYLDLRLAVRTVKNLAEAIDHINTYGSHHTDAIVTGSKREAAAFIQQVDSSSVMVNASTRFSDGGEYGMGCEIGISTDKLHARGPMGVADLTTYKWIVYGSGQVRG
ncbi:MAG: glutamate-5-semialdehyde dehydrogenase [Chitinispirillaceae bacterium]|nr:glutamate-5-semialdehyde dehydrogenase [Chitinispirillaceae bacterium]